MADPAPLPLLLLPGTLCDGRLFAPLLERLPAREVVVPSFRENDVAAAARRLLAEAPPRFALLGFSLGGIVALEMALAAPERIAGLALIDSNLAPVDPALHAGRRDEASAATGRIGEHVAEALWPSYVAPDRQDDADLRALLVAMAEEAGHASYVAQTDLALSRTDRRVALAGLTMPVLVLAGADDTLASAALQHEVVGLLPDAALALVDGAGHFAPLERPDAVAAHVAAWLARVDAAPTAPSPDLLYPAHSGGPMNKTESAPAAKSNGNGHAQPDDPKAVLQVERRDFTELVPTDRPRVQSMRGFDPIYTDIVDYIVRCTHRIWDERDVGLIYSHYTHNCVAYTTLGTMYDRETHIRDTIQRLVEFPDRRGLAQQVIWNGNDVDGFYTSHMTHGQGRHSQYGMYGKPTGRTFLTRTVADCMIVENKIYKEWIVRDNMGPLIQLGLDPAAYAADLAQRKFDKGEPMMEVVENRRLLGQYPPETEADVSIANTEGEAQLLRDLHHIYNKRMFGRIHEIYAPNCQWHGPLMREYYGVAAVLQQTMRLVALIADGAFVPQHICSVESEESGVKYAVRWTLDGHHLGYGSLGAPTGHPLFVMGVTHYHVRDGRIVDEWAVYDELSMLAQIKLAELHQFAG